jgi:hypothetical protein
MRALLVFACAISVVGCGSSDGGDDGGADQFSPDVTTGTDASKDSTTNDAPSDSTTNDAPSDSTTNDASDSGTNDASDAGGCDANTTSDPQNCGSCGNICGYGPHSTAGCTKSTCTLICDVGYADCNTQATDGCEVDTNVDINNCGKCKQSCLKNQQCLNGQCI